MVDPLRLCARLGDEVTDLRRLAAYDVDTLLADRDKLKSVKYGFVVFDRFRRALAASVASDADNGETSPARE